MSIETGERKTLKQAFEEFVARRSGDIGRFEEVDESWFRNRYIVRMVDARLREQTINDLLNINGVVKIHLAQVDELVAPQSIANYMDTTLGPDAFLLRPRSSRA